MRLAILRVARIYGYMAGYVIALNPDGPTADGPDGHGLGTVVAFACYNYFRHLEAFSC